MVQLIDIREYIEKFVYIASTILEMEILICDTSGHIVGDSERRGNMCAELENLRESSVISKSMKCGKIIVFGNAKEENEGCINCPKRKECNTETIIAYPIKRNNVVYGGIGVYSNIIRQQEKLIRFQNIMMDFLGSIGDLVITKLEDEEASIEMKAENLRMNSIIESLDFALLSIDEDANVLYSNKLMDNIINVDENVEHIRKYIKSGTSDFKKDERNIYLLKDGKMVEYEITYIPITINDKSKGAEIHLKETSAILSKATQLIEPVKEGCFDDIIGTSQKLQKVKSDAMAFADSKSNVLLLGESGTGKEVFATAIHNAGKRSDGPFVTVNCAAIPDNLLESELFGYVKGAFTGALKEGRAGKFEIANGGTLFLDEIGELPIYLQPKLLRALQEQKIQRVGSNRNIDIDIRIIAATNRNLTEMMENGSFREDLYYRLCVIPIRIPPLRERREDIPLLAEYFMKRYKNMLEKSYIEGFDEKTSLILKNYSWMGNVRELQNTIEYAVNRCNNRVISIQDLPERIIQNGQEEVEKPRTLREVERETIINALKYYGKTAEGKSRAAEEIGISRATLYRKIIEYGIDSEILI